MVNSVLFAFVFLATLGVNTTSGSPNCDGRLIRRSLWSRVPKDVKNLPMGPVKEEPEELAQINEAVHGADQSHGAQLHEAGGSFISKLPDESMKIPSTEAEMRDRLESWEPSRFLPNEFARAIESLNKEERREHILKAIDYIRRKFYTVTDLQSVQRPFEWLRELLLPELYFIDSSNVRAWLDILKESEQSLKKEVVNDPGSFFWAIFHGLSRAKKELRETTQDSTEAKVGSKKHPIIIADNQGPNSKKLKLSSSADESPEAEMAEADEEEKNAITAQKIRAYADTVAKNREVNKNELEKQDDLLPSKILSYAMARPLTDTGNAFESTFDNTLRYDNFARVVLADSQLLLWIKMGFEKTVDPEDAWANMASFFERIYSTSYIVASSHLTWGKPAGVLSHDPFQLRESEYHRMDEARVDAMNRIKTVLSWFLPEIALSGDHFKQLMEGTLDVLKKTPYDSSHEWFMKGIPRDIEKIVGEVNAEAKSREPLYRKLEHLEKMEVEKNQAMAARGFPKAKVHRRALDLLITVFKMQIKTKGNDDIMDALKTELDTLRRMTSDVADVAQLEKILNEILADAKNSPTVSNLSLLYNRLKARAALKLRSTVRLP